MSASTSFHSRSTALIPGGSRASPRLSKLTLAPISRAERALAREEQPLGAAGALSARLSASVPSSQPVPGGLLEVVAHDLVELDEVARRAARASSAKRSCSSARAAFGSASYAASRISRCGGSGRRRRPGSCARSGRTSSLRTSAEQLARRRRLVRRERLRRRRGGTPAPSTDAALEHRALGRVELVEPRREQRLDRRRHRDLAPSGDSRTHRDHLLDEERVALGGRRGSARAAPASTSPPSSVEQRVASRPRRAARAGRVVAFSFRRPSRAGGRAAPAAPCRGAGSARRARGRRRARPGRGSVGSPQWRSSSTTTSGRSRGRLLEQLAERPGDLLGRRRRLRLAEQRRASAPRTAASARSGSVAELLQRPRPPASR